MQSAPLSAHHQVNPSAPLARETIRAFLVFSIVLAGPAPLTTAEAKPKDPPGHCGEACGKSGAAATSPSLRQASATLEAAEGQKGRPANLLMLQERISHQGLLSTGVFDPSPDPVLPGLWRVKLWRETPDRVNVSVDVVNCDPSSPMRLTGHDDRLVVRELNPGGRITLANRLDHLVWWAVCFPAHAGRDPATLSAVARDMGFSGRLPEREQVLPAPVDRLRE